MNLKYLQLAVFFLIIFCSCSKEENKVEIRYQLETSAATGDHFFVSYINATNDTITEHAHPGWTTSFAVSKPFNAFIKTEVIPIDNYNFTVTIARNGEVIKSGTASTASGAKTTIILEHIEK